jgi:hypothetical protein
MTSKNKMMNRIAFAAIRAGLTQIFFLAWSMQSAMGFLLKPFLILENIML